MTPSLTATSTRSCPQCGGKLPQDAPEDLCPACVLALGARASENSAGQDNSSSLLSDVDFAAPDVETVARDFPQLQVLGFLGRGGMGFVYKARQPSLDRLVALKLLPREVSSDPNFVARFSREAQTLAKLSHNNIVAIHDFGEVNGWCYFVMEYVDGPNLREASRNAKLKPRHVLQIVSQICDALQYAHDRGVVHRDIKPENVLLDKSGRVKIADFGLAKLLGHAHPPAELTRSRMVMGTPHYMAPEQIEHPQEVDHRADIFSLGVVFYELLTGELPVGHFQPPSKKAAIDTRLDEIVLKTLCRERELRYQHARDVGSHVSSIRRDDSTLVRFQCTSCGKRLTAPEQQTGKSFKCPHCGISIVVPEKPRATAVSRKTRTLARRRLTIAALLILLCIVGAVFYAIQSNMNGAPSSDEVTRTQPSENLPDPTRPQAAEKRAVAKPAESPTSADAAKLGDRADRPSADGSPDPVASRPASEVFQEGLNLLKQPQFVKQAMAQFTLAIAANPLMASAYNNRGACYLETGDLDKALDDFNRALEIEPQLSAARVNRGRTYQARGDSARALADYSDAIAKNKRLWLAVVARGDFYESREQHKDAIADYTAAIQIDRTYPFAYLCRAEAHLNTGRVDDAVKDYTSFLATTPAPIVYFRRSLALKRLGNANDADKDHAAALREDARLKDVVTEPSMTIRFGSLLVNEALEVVGARFMIRIEPGTGRASDVLNEPITVSVKNSSDSSDAPKPVEPAPTASRRKEDIEKQLQQLKGNATPSTVIVVQDNEGSYWATRISSVKEIKQTQITLERGANVAINQSGSDPLPARIIPIMVRLVNNPPPGEMATDGQGGIAAIYGEAKKDIVVDVKQVVHTVETNGDE